MTDTEKAQDAIAVEHVIWLRATGHTLAEATAQAKEAMREAGLAAPLYVGGWDHVTRMFALAWASMMQPGRKAA